MSELRYLPAELITPAHIATQDSDDPELFDVVLKLLQTAYSHGYDDGYTRGVVYKDAERLAAHNRARRRETKGTTK